MQGVACPGPASSKSGAAWSRKSHAAPMPYGATPACTIRNILSGIGDPLDGPPAPLRQRHRHAHAPVRMFHPRITSCQPWLALILLTCVGRRCCGCVGRVYGLRDPRQTAQGHRAGCDAAERCMSGEDSMGKPCGTLAVLPGGGLGGLRRGVDPDRCRDYRPAGPDPCSRSQPDLRGDGTGQAAMRPSSGARRWRRSSPS